LIILLGLILVLARAVTYVSPTGHDIATCGPQNMPCETVGYAVMQAKGGQVILMDGTYYVNSSITLQNNLNLMANETNQAIVDPTYYQDKTSLFQDGMTISMINITGVLFHNITTSIYTSQNAQDVMFNNVTFRNSSISELQISGDSAVVIICNCLFQEGFMLNLAVPGLIISGTSFSGKSDTDRVTIHAFPQHILHIENSSIISTANPLFIFSDTNMNGKMGNVSIQHSLLQAATPLNVSYSYVTLYDISVMGSVACSNSTIVLQNLGTGLYVESDEACTSCTYVGQKAICPLSYFNLILIPIAVAGSFVLGIIVTTVLCCVKNRHDYQSINF